MTTRLKYRVQTFRNISLKFLNWIYSNSGDSPKSLGRFTLSSARGGERSWLINYQQIDTV